MIRLAALLASLALALGTPAAAGGWAMTTFDQLPPEFVAGQTYRLGYTIRQHGATPIRVDRTEIVVIRAVGGVALSFAGVPEGSLGHYVADVTLPAGTYSWRVTQEPFAAQDLGNLTVAGAAVAPAAPAAGPATAAPPPLIPPLPPLVAALAVATLAAAALFASRLARHARRHGAIAAP